MRKQGSKIWRLEMMYTCMARSKNASGEVRNATKHAVVGNRAALF